MPVDADLADVRRAALSGRQDGAANLAGGDRAHGYEAGRLEVDLAADLRRERVHDVVADERVVDGIAVVAAAEMRVTVVDLEVADPHRHDLEERLQRREVDRRLVDLQVSVLHPRLVVMAGREVARQRDADAGCELGVEREVRRRVIEAEANVRELVGVDAIHDVRCRRVLC